MQVAFRSHLSGETALRCDGLPVYEMDRPCGKPKVTAGPSASPVIRHAAKGEGGSQAGKDASGVASPVVFHGSATVYMRADIEQSRCPG